MKTREQAIDEAAEVFADVLDEMRKAGTWPPVESEPRQDDDTQRAA